MVIEMVDGEPPLFHCRPTEAMQFIRDHSTPQLRHPEKVRGIETESVCGVSMLRCLSTPDTNGAEESVIVSEVSSFQTLKCMQEWCTWGGKRCPV